MAKGGGKGGDDRRNRLAQALRANLRLRKQAEVETMPRREDRLEPRISSSDETSESGQNHVRKP